MLTRIEIDGFKTFRDFALDLPPFLVVLGQNGSGKSNLFDALRFLSRLSQEPVLDAAQHGRGDLLELFHQDADGNRVNRMRFAVEVLLDREITDTFGESQVLGARRLRYEVELELREVPVGYRLFVADESARSLNSGEDRWVNRFPDLAQRLNSGDVVGDTTYLETTAGIDDLRYFIVDNRLRLPAGSATATVLSVIGTATESAVLYALKRELSTWRQLHLDSVALREPDSFEDPSMFGPGGTHLPNVLRRIAETTGGSDRPNGILNDISADLASVIPDVSGMQIDEDPKRRRREIEFRGRGGREPMSARVVSDGTLRAAALLAAAYDPLNSGLLCFEEPENGIYPQQFLRLVQNLRSIVDRAVTRRSGDPGAPLVQLLLSSHSPAILRALEPSVGGEIRRDAVFLTTVSRIMPGRFRSRITQPRLIGTGGRPPRSVQEGRDPNERLISAVEIAEFEVHQALGN